MIVGQFCQLKLVETSCWAREGLDNSLSSWNRLWWLQNTDMYSLGVLEVKDCETLTEKQRLIEMIVFYCTFPVCFCNSVLKNDSFSQSGCILILFFIQICLKLARHGAVEWRYLGVYLGKMHELFCRWKARKGFFWKKASFMRTLKFCALLSLGFWI